MRCAKRFSSFFLLPALALVAAIAFAPTWFSRELPLAATTLRHHLDGSTTGYVGYNTGPGTVTVDSGRLLPQRVAT